MTQMKMKKQTRRRIKMNDIRTKMSECNGDVVVISQKQAKEHWECPFFKNGKKMLEALKGLKRSAAGRKKRCSDR